MSPAPDISVIIPVHNGGSYLRSSLKAIAASKYHSFEPIVVDDASTDGSSNVAYQFGARVVRISRGPLGPAYARNRGAEIARGEMLFFVDADVVIAPEALERVAKGLRESPEIAAVFGSYDSRPQAQGVVSQYRNLLHHYVHQNGASEASTFWAGCGAIRRSVFDTLGGFDEIRFSRPSIEDIELGYRLRRSGYRILLDKTLQGTHLKKWTLWSLIQTDIACRAMPWSRLILESKTLPNDLNLKWGQRLSFALVALACVLLVLTVLQPLLIAGSAAALLGVGLINRDLYGFFVRQRGVLFAAACIPLHLLYYLYSGISYLAVWLEFQTRRKVGWYTRTGRKRATPIDSTRKRHLENEVSRNSLRQL